jgi:hypothetical protein
LGAASAADDATARPITSAAAVKRFFNMDTVPRFLIRLVCKAQG